MNLFALGLNHNTAPLALREKVAFSSELVNLVFAKVGDAQVDLFFDDPHVLALDLFEQHDALAIRHCAVVHSVVQ